MEELKPCPFCGGEAAVYGVDSYYVACCRCEAQTARYKTAQEAIVNWNRRAAPENKPLTLEQLRQMDREPVWVVMIGEAKPPICEIVVECYKDGIKMASTEDTDDYGAFDLYGKTWLAYARRPEDAK